MSERKKEECPVCGKKLLAVRKHVKRSHPDYFKESFGERTAKIEQTEDNEQKFVKIEEVKIVATKLDPKKKQDDDEFECGKCGELFNKKVKFCPGCGVEFE